MSKRFFIVFLLLFSVLMGGCKQNDEKKPDQPVDPVVVDPIEEEPVIPPQKPIVILPDKPEVNVPGRLITTNLNINHDLNVEKYNSFGSNYYGFAGEENDYQFIMLDQNGNQISHEINQKIHSVISATDDYLYIQSTNYDLDKQDIYKVSNTGQLEATYTVSSEHALNIHRFSNGNIIFLINVEDENYLVLLDTDLAEISKQKFEGTRRVNTEHGDQVLYVTEKSDSLQVIRDKEGSSVIVYYLVNSSGEITMSQEFSHSFGMNPYPTNDGGLIHDHTEGDNHIITKLDQNLKVEWVKSVGVSVNRIIEFNESIFVIKGSNYLIYDINGIEIYRESNRVIDVTTIDDVLFLTVKNPDGKFYIKGFNEQGTQLWSVQTRQFLMRLRSDDVNLKYYIYYITGSQIGIINQEGRHKVSQVYNHGMVLKHQSENGKLLFAGGNTDIPFIVNEDTSITIMYHLDITNNEIQYITDDQEVIITNDQQIKVYDPSGLRYEYPIGPHFKSEELTYFVKDENDAWAKMLFNYSEIKPKEPLAGEIKYDLNTDIVPIDITLNELWNGINNYYQTIDNFGVLEKSSVDTGYTEYSIEAMVDYYFDKKTIQSLLKMTTDDDSTKATTVEQASYFIYKEDDYYIVSDALKRYNIGPMIRYNVTEEEFNRVYHDLIFFTIDYEPQHIDYTKQFTRDEVKYLEIKHHFKIADLDPKYHDILKDQMLVFFGVYFDSINLVDINATTYIDIENKKIVGASYDFKEIYKVYENQLNINLTYNKHLITFYDMPINSLINTNEFENAMLDDAPNSATDFGQLKLETGKMINGQINYLLDVDSFPFEVSETKKYRFKVESDQFVRATVVHESGILVETLTLYDELFDGTEMFGLELLPGTYYFQVTGLFVTNPIDYQVEMYEVTEDDYADGLSNETIGLLGKINADTHILGKSNYEGDADVFLLDYKIDNSYNIIIDHTNENFIVIKISFDNQTGHATTNLLEMNGSHKVIANPSDYGRTNYYIILSDEVGEYELKVVS